MIIRQVVGSSILLSPLIALTIYIVRESGWIVALQTWGTVAAICATSWIGVALLSK